MSQETGFGRIRDESLKRVQRRRKLVILLGLIAALVFLAVTQSAFSSSAPFHINLEHFGVGLIVVCIVGRTWSSLYIGGSKRVALVDIGPYSVVRNPLYVFTIIGATGIGFATGSVIIGLSFGLITFLVFHTVVLSEERYLREKFGQVFEEYVKGAPRWWPRLSGWHDAEWVRVRPSIVRTTFLDASLFLIAYPVCEGIEWMQDAGILPVLLQLP